MLPINKNLVYPTALLAGFFIVWEVLTRIFAVPSYILPSPSNIYLKFMSVSGNVFDDLIVTSLESVLGLILAILFACVVSLIFHKSKPVRDGVYPLLIALKCTPIIAIAPLLILWIGFGIFSKVVMAAIVSFFPIVVNLTVGLKQADESHVLLFKSYRASWWSELLHLRIPTAIPYFFASLRIAAPLSVVGAVVAEFMGASKGVGFAILMSSYNADTPLLFVNIFVAALIGITMYCVVLLIEFFFNQYQPNNLESLER